MDTYSAAYVARACGTSIPRVQRAIDRLGMASSRGDSGRVALTSGQVRCLLDDLGAHPRVAGLSTTEAKVLSALARAPLGLTSVRSVARRSGVSPTAAGRAIADLQIKRLVVRRELMIAAGSAKRVDLIQANVGSDRWFELARQLSRVSVDAQATADHGKVPHRLRHLFWNVDSSQLSVGNADAFIARRLITSGDPEGLAWGASHLSADAWRHAAQTRGLDPQDRALAWNLAGATPR